MLTLTSPWLLLLLLLLPLPVWLKRRHPRRLAPGQHQLLLVTRGAVLVFLTLALAGPVWHHRRERIAVLFAIDVSRSVAPGFLDRTLRWVERVTAERGSEVVGFLGFADHAARADTAAGLRSLPVSSERQGEEVGSGLDRDVTDLETALGTALALFPESTSRRLVLVSDGRETRGDVTRVVARARRNRVRLFALPADTRDQSRAWIDRVRLPAGSVVAGAPIAVAVEVTSLAAGSGVVELREGGELLDRRAVELSPGRLQVPFRIDMPEPGLARLEVVLLDREPETAAALDRRQASVWVEEGPRLLLVEGGEAAAPTGSRGHHLAAVLSAAGFDVSRRVASDAGLPPLPSTPAGLERYDGVVLSELSPSSWQESQMSALAEYVVGGGGLVFITGAAGYGKDGYSYSRLEEMLPVSFEIPEERREVALVIALDKSYSMEGRKIELAKQAARAVVDVLEEEHEFGLVAFDWNPYTIVPLQPAADRAAIKGMIGRVEASAQTNFFPALETSVGLLGTSEARTKHIILLSDGKTYPDEYERLLGEIRAADITVSTVGVGAEADRELLADIARWGGGRSYYLADAGGVERILIDETQITVQDTLEETPFRPTVAAPLAALAGLDFAAAPPLLGYAVTRLKESAEPILLTEEGDPLLVQWHYGLGRVLVFTSDAKERWAAEWLGWGGFGKLWAQVVRQALAAGDGLEPSFAVTRTGSRVQADLDVPSRRGGFRDGLVAGVRLTGPSGSSSTHALEQVGPGAYRAQLELRPDPTGPYRFELEVPGIPPRQAGLFYPAPDEYRPGLPDLELLGRLAAATGGKLSPSVEEIFAADETVASQTELWPFLVGLALVLYFLDLGLRRTPWAHRVPSAESSAAAARVPREAGAG